MDNRALEGAASIVTMTIIIIVVINYLRPDLLRIPPLILGIIVFVGLINGYIFREAIKKSVVYIVVIGEALIAVLFVVFYFGFQNDLANSTNTGLQGLGLIFVFIVLLALIIAGFFGLLIFGIIIYIPAIIGANIRGSK